jgi:hypothetical protein
MRFFPFLSGTGSFKVSGWTAAFERLLIYEICQLSGYNRLRGLNFRWISVMC